jgi:RNA polymerase sigma-70 factor (ECF subfamily)
MPLPDNALTTATPGCAGISGPRTTERAMEPPSDVEIVHRIEQGDIAAFEILMRRYNQRLFRVARGIVGNDGEAEDVVQDAYVRAFEHLDQFAGRSQFSTWLTKIAVYEALARRRAQRRLQVVGAAEIDSMPAHRATPDAAETASRHELAHILADAVDSLPEELRAVVALRMIDNASTAETAECLELTEANVKVRLHRAKLQLRQSIDARLGQEVRQLYAIDGERCDRIVERVFARITK